jgi:hypothetical protein
VWVFFESAAQFQIQDGMPKLKIEQINPENASENLFRAEPASNQRLGRLLFEIRSSSTDTEEKALIFCMSGSHNEVLMHYPG